MIEKIEMPAMGATMEEGTLTVWRVSENDVVKKGDVLFEFESDKSTFEYESPCDGTVRVLLVEEGEVVPVLAAVAVVGDPADPIPPDWIK